MTDEARYDVTRWKHKWSGNCDNENPRTLVETLDHANPQLYPGIYVALVTLLSYPLSTCAAERSFSGMKRLKTPLQSTMSEEKLSFLAILHIHKHKNVDIDNVVSNGRKGETSHPFPVETITANNTLIYTYISITKGWEINNKITEFQHFFMLWCMKLSPRKHGKWDFRAPGKNPTYGPPSVRT